MNVFGILKKVLFGTTKKEREEKFIKNWMQTNPEPVDAGRLVICELHDVCDNYICYSHFPHKKSSFCSDGSNNTGCYHTNLLDKYPDRRSNIGLVRHSCIDVPISLKDLKYPQDLFEKDACKNMPIFKERYELTKIASVSDV